MMQQGAMKHESVESIITYYIYIYIHIHIHTYIHTYIQEKMMQQGAMKHESVESNIKEALSKHELTLLEKRAGWKSEAELKKAEKFAEVRVCVCNI